MSWKHGLVAMEDSYPWTVVIWGPHPKGEADGRQQLRVGRLGPLAISPDTWGPLLPPNRTLKPERRSQR